MKVQKFEDRDQWKDARRGRITGTRAGNLLSKRDGKTPLKGFYELIAERVAIPRDDENRMDRGLRLEDEAIQRFAKETGKKVTNDLVIWSRDEDEDIAISPDAQVGKKGAIECKCLDSAAHIEAYLTKRIPKDYDAQALQYFVVNDALETLYFIFYDPSMPIDFFYIEVKREDMEEEIEAALVMQREVLKKVEEIEQQLTF